MATTGTVAVVVIFFSAPTLTQRMAGTCAVALTILFSRGQDKLFIP